MDRKDWVWVVVKAFGVYLGVETLVAVPGMLMVLSNLPSSGQALFGFFSSFLIKAALSFYLLRSGRLVFRLIGAGTD
jgi:hypothetical protein